MSSILTNTMNITDNPLPTKCYEKCLYSFNYPNSNHCTVTNIDNQYFKLDYNYSTTNSPATFNNIDYTVEKICIYFPSLHNFNNSPVTGEIVIYHGGNDGTRLNVCIPLNLDGGIPCPLLNDIFNEIINNQITDSNPHDLSLDQDYNINAFVKYAPYYYYLDNNTNFIVYGINDGILITKDVYDSIKSLITKTYQQFPYISNLNYNEKGPYNTGGDEIYIDCQPVDEDGTLLIDKSNKDFYKNFGIINPSNTVNIILVSIFCALLVFLLVIYIVSSFGNSTVSQSFMSNFVKQFNENITKSSLNTTNTILSRGLIDGLDGIVKDLQK